MDVFAGVWEFVTFLAASRRWIFWAVMAIAVLGAGIWLLEVALR